ncbi:MAG: leucine-rich repeat domain-containing protein [Clostridia bacterium]|nr:leucine-rich repeat domain-containing protein [Clostridia bacterium]
MNKKFWASVALCLALALPLGLTACGGGTDGGNSTGVYTYETAYAAAADLGFEGTLEEFIEMISGKDGKDGVNGTNGKDGVDGKDGINGTNGKDGVDGVGIKSVTMNSEGELVITGTNDEILFQGKVTCKHSYSPFEMKLTPTCTSSGLRKRTCKKCGNIDYNFLTATGHMFEKKIDLSHPANCQEKGDCLFVCSTCSTAIASEFYGEHAYEKGICTLCGAEKGSDGLEYTLNADYKTYSVSGIGECTETDIIIPKDYLGLPVTEIGKNAFRIATITSVKILDNITTIQYCAFGSCKNLKHVEMQNGVKEIRSGAFLHCIALEEITIPDSVTVMTGSPFFNCENLKTVKLSANLQKVSSQTFYGCSNLTEITIPNSLTELSSGMFYKCKKLKTVILGKDLTSISEFAFERCPSLESIYFGGTEQQWEELNKPYEIHYLENVNIYFYSETEPEGEGNFWHYVNDEPVMWG